MKYQVEYAKFVKVEIEAASLEEAKEKSYVLDDDYIEKHGEVEPPDYQVWNEARPI
jgi:hypothetical protein